MPRRFSYIKRFILNFLLLLIPVVIVGILYFMNRLQRFEISIRKEQEKEVELKVRQLSDYFGFIESEMLTIAQQRFMPGVFSDNKNIKDSATLYMQDYFSGMIANSGFFDQIRIICPTGIEHVRVNNVDGKPVVVKPEELVDISDRYYFKRAVNLKGKTFYISKFDFDPEKKSISYPIKPILRIATPIVKNGKTYGILIVNIKGHEFFENLRIIGNEYGWETFFLNQAGNYLMGPDPLKEWLSFKDSINAPRFQDDFGSIQILNKPDEQKTFMSNYGLFTYFRIDQSNFAVTTNGSKMLEENWYVVSYIPMEKLIQIRRELFDIKDAILLMAGLLLVMLLSFLFTNNIKKRFEFENQLIASERDLKMANKTKDKFISILAHDLKNPLASITGFTEIMKSDYESMSKNARDKVFGAMENATQVLLRLIDDILTWARSQSGSIVVDPEIIFINKVIDDAIKISALQANRKAVKIVRDCDMELFAMADQQMIETVLRNLIGNAIKFSFRGNEVVVGLRLSEKKDSVIIYVKDSGIGISNQDKEKLFSLDSVKTTPGTENESGTGMGLILCKDFIERNHGKLWFESKEGYGSTFFFSLPAYNENET